MISRPIQPLSRVFISLDLQSPVLRRLIVLFVEQISGNHQTVRLTHFIDHTEPPPTDAAAHDDAASLIRITNLWIGHGGFDVAWRNAALAHLPSSVRRI